MVSGTGHVSKDIDDKDLLDAWADTLKKWHANLAQRPKQVVTRFNFSYRVAMMSVDIDVYDMTGGGPVQKRRTRGS